jgi:hypothetical protein
MTQNAWILSNKKNMEDVKRLMIEFEYRPEFQNFPLRTIQHIINGAEAEILRLQKLLDGKK